MFFLFPLLLEDRPFLVPSLPGFSDGVSFYVLFLKSYSSLPGPPFLGGVFSLSFPLPVSVILEKIRAHTPS